MLLSVFPFTKTNTTLSPGFLGQRFNDLQRAALFDVIDSIFGQQQLVMANYACGFNQSETGKYFE